MKMASEIRVSMRVKLPMEWGEKSFGKTKYE